jgi:hypothetical protein
MKHIYLPLFSYILSNKYPILVIESFLLFSSQYYINENTSHQKWQRMPLEDSCTSPEYASPLALNISQVSLYEFACCWIEQTVAVQGIFPKVQHLDMTWVCLSDMRTGD